MPKKQIFILDPPDRRSVPTVSLLRNFYDFHFLIPIRKKVPCQTLAKAALRICKPRGARSITFVPFENEEDMWLRCREILATRPCDAVLPFSERSTAMVLSHVAEMPHNICVPMENLKIFHQLNDKWSVYKEAAKVGLPVPATIAIDSVTDLKRTDTLGFPLVLKCCRASGRDAIRICSNFDELETAYAQITSGEETYSFFSKSMVIAQEYINGKIYDGCFALKQGQVVASMTQIREWTIPPSGGFGAFNKTQNIPELHAYGQRFFERMEWSGPAQMEWILDSRDKQYKLIEINPRFWGTLGLALKAGILFPQAVLASAMNESLPEMLEPADGIEFRWLFQETLFAETLNGRNIWGALFRHFCSLFSSKQNNFSYSFLINCLLSVPHILTSLKGIKGLESREEGLASRLFA